MDKTLRAKCIRKSEIELFDEVHKFAKEKEKTIKFLIIEGLKLIMKKYDK